MQEIKVTLIIPCRNEENYIQECINSALKQTYKNVEILVVDGMSEDKTIDIVKNMSSIHNNIRLINNFKMITPCALNIGIEESSGQAIIIIGAHSYLDEKFVENNVRNLYEKGYDCSGGVIETINENYIGGLISKAMSCPFGVGNALFRYTDKELEVDTVPFGAYKKETLNKIGYFDTELVRNQDDELNLRLINNGGKILLSPDIKSKYYSRGSLKKLWKQYFQYGFWKVRVIQKHKKPASLRHLVPIIFVLSLIFLGFGSLFSNIIRWALLSEVLLYLILGFSFGIKISNDRNIKSIFILPLIFFILHFSYGLGFGLGIINFYFKSNEDIINENTKISR